MKNTINTIILSDYSEYDEHKCRNGGAYGYDYIYTYDYDSNSFSYEWTTTSELIPDSEPSGSYSLSDVLTEMSDFIRGYANFKNCAVYVNGVCVWESTPVENMDVDTSNYFLED